MVAWTEGFLAALAYGSTIVATLRAGSRALYLMEHDHIGIMEGSLILGPESEIEDGEGSKNEPSALWELAHAFQRSVKLGLDDGTMEYQISPVTAFHLDHHIQEPYSLSPYPVKHTTKLVKDDHGLEGGHVDDQVESVVVEFKESTLSKLTAFIPKMPDIPLARWTVELPSSIVNMSGILLKWKKKAWASTGRVDDSTDDDKSLDDMIDSEEWDFETIRSSDVTFTTTNYTERTAHITAYAPNTFADLRSRFGIAEDEFQQSILYSGPFVSFQSNSKGAARIGGIFFFTRDGAYMIKTIKKEEAQTLLEMLPKYHKYMKRNGRRSLLTRFCGMYAVTLSDPDVSGDRGIAEQFLPRRDKEHVFVVMNSVFPAESSAFISERFDLKGSTVGRECSDEEKEEKGSSAVLKDLDLAREVELVRSLQRSNSRSAKYGLHLGASAKAALLSQLRRDVGLLIACGVMDYSLLVGVVNMDSHHIDGASIRALELSQQQEIRMRGTRRKQSKHNLQRAVVSSLLTPVRLVSAPPLYFGRKAFTLLESTLSSILTWPLPYYGAGICGVDGGTLSVIEGSRAGNRALFYLGLIDFLQPWTTRKVVERQLKRVMGYDIRAISCVPPEEYASRFLEFIDAHVS